MAEPLRVKVHHRLAERHRRAWLVGAVIPGLLAVALGILLGQGGDALLMVVLGLGMGATTIGILGMAGEFADKRPPPTDATPPAMEPTESQYVAITVEGDHDTITVNVFHLLTASWATTVDLADGTSLVASTHGDVLEVRDSSTGVITRADVDASGAVSVSCAADVPIIVGALRALAGQLLGSGHAYEPSVTVQAASAPVIALGTGPTGPDSVSGVDSR